MKLWIVFAVLVFAWLASMLGLYYIGAFTWLFFFGALVILVLQLSRREPKGHLRREPQG